VTIQSAVLRALRKPRGTAQQGFGATARRDAWAITPAVQGTAFTVLAGYLFFSGIVWNPLFGTPFEVEGYLSPLFSPWLFKGELPWFISPGLLILWIPLGFRATCYYYRKAYYRFYFADPPACAVGEPRVHRAYGMEAKLPFILQNLHRYFLYLAFIPLTFLWLDLVPAFLPPEGDHAGQLRVGFGGGLFLVNVVLLSGFSLSCNSLRHLAGGRIDCFSCSRRHQVQHSLWQRITALNRHHMGWAWVSFISVTLADVYVRLLALGVITDPAIFFQV
jgi:hypothetical protein